MSFANGVDEKSKSFMIGGYTLCEKMTFICWLSVVYNGCNPLQNELCLFRWGYTLSFLLTISVLYAKIGNGCNPLLQNFIFLF